MINTVEGCYILYGVYHLMNQKIDIPVNFFMNSFNCSTWDNFVCTAYSTMYIQQRDISPLLETSFFVPLTFFANKYRKYRTKDSNPSHHKKRKCRSPVCSDFEWCVRHRGRDTDDGRK